MATIDRSGIYRAKSGHSYFFRAGYEVPDVTLEHYLLDVQGDSLNECEQKIRQRDALKAERAAKPAPEPADAAPAHAAAPNDQRADQRAKKDQAAPENRAGLPAADNR